MFFMGVFISFTTVLTSFSSLTLSLVRSNLPIFAPLSDEESIGPLYFVDSMLETPLAVVLGAREALDGFKTLSCVGSDWYLLPIILFPWLRRTGNLSDKTMAGVDFTVGVFIFRAGEDPASASILLTGDRPFFLTLIGDETIADVDFAIGVFNFGEKEDLAGDGIFASADLGFKVTSSFFSMLASFPSDTSVLSLNRTLVVG
ncbi:putative serine-rich protein-like [Iris pallida]|uniref:Serine-rich protein-like n=1 Tax=Iris pallida TaxID=29817 RepID=A0AAX6DUD2_IRIPA|nr:putative serine-rich protein-like [Iris pallida]